VSSLARTSLDGAVASLKLNEDGAPVDPPSADDKTLLEHALCRVMFSLIEDASASSTAFMSHVASGAKKGARPSKGAHVPSMPRLLDLALEMSETGIVEAACVFNALEQLVETCTIADCTDVFTWVESKRSRLRSESLWRRGKLVMLRTCNELQRRLSKTADTVLRGRVLLLLSSLYPLSERSALNLGGNYNVGNTVELDTRHFNADTPKESGKKGSGRNRGRRRGRRGVLRNLLVAPEVLREPSRGARIPVWVEPLRQVPQRGAGQLRDAQAG
jgi:THO complex subunit 1